MEKLTNDLKALQGVGLFDAAEKINPENLALDAVRVNMSRRPFRDCAYGGTYDWSQSTANAILYLPVPPNTRGRSLSCKIARKTFTFGLKGEKAWIDGPTGGEVDSSLSTWTLENGLVEVTLTKKQHGEWEFPVKAEKFREFPVKAEKFSPLVESKKNSKPKTLGQGHVGVEGRTTISRVEEQKSKHKSDTKGYKYAPRPLPEQPKREGESKISKKRDKWSTFDADQALADLENEDKPADPGWSVKKEPGLATIESVGYEKSKEEVALDHDLASGMQRMKIMLRNRLAGAQQSKEKGNNHVKNKKWQEALECYEDGSSQLGLAKTASPLMSASLQERVKKLNIALMNNTALCHLKLGQFKDSIAAAEEVLQVDSKNYKALCRKGASLTRVGKKEEARKVLQLALKLAPAKATAKKLLDEI
ncbi:hypothetical protein AAMO2058_000995700 [Amorphochlora amoebiformis]